jgi:hypothetical protein
MYPCSRRAYMVVPARDGAIDWDECARANEFGTIEGIVCNRLDKTVF